MGFASAQGFPCRACYTSSPIMSVVTRIAEGCDCPLLRWPRTRRRDEATRTSGGCELRKPGARNLNFIRSAQEFMKVAFPDAKRMTGNLRHVLVSLVFISTASSGLAQTAAPTPGGILNELERRLPTQPLTAPDGAKIEIPDAPALNAASNDARVTVRSYRITGNTAFDEATL